VKRAVIVPLLLLCFLACSPGLTLLSWNVENLFDDVDDGTEFADYDPGRGRWDSEGFRLRVDTVAEVIRKAVPGGPDVIVLQEVENANALRALVAEALKDLGYAWVAIVPKPGLPANVAVVSRVPIARVHTIEISAYGGNELRDLLEVEIEQGGHQLHVIDNHWKAKSGGTRETEPWRIEAAARLGRRVREILAADPSADVVAAGDFNESVDEWRQADRAWQVGLVPVDENPPTSFLDRTILLADDTDSAGLHDGALALYDPWFEIAESERGSYRYQGRWQTVDHVLLSPGLFDDQGWRYRPGGFRVMRLSFMLNPDGTPKRWTRLAGQRGYSDHLPLLLTLDIAN
jgi:endonuclease/exonuclease/phosphatase family metal-dependent hydrolase